MSILQKIHGHDDLVRLTDSERQALCTEIRNLLVSSVAKTGGHLASNLGAVELTVAIETVFNTMRDRLVFDVGHQSYVHKLLTGRQADFSHLRQYGGISGFPKPHESEADAFVAGHASSSISIALGMARARTLMGEDYHVLALLGDGAATGGMVYEALSDASETREPMIIILNDNEMSIDRNVGGLSRHLSRLRMKEQYLGMKRKYRRIMERIPGGQGIYRVTKGIKDRIKRFLIPATFFENIGLNYLGPVNGHDLPELIRTLKSARDMHAPVVIHVLTQKGHGFAPAEENPSLFHGIGKFDPVTGQPLSKGGPSFSDAFGETLVELATQDQRICAITAAMPGGTGLLPFKEAYLHRTFDVGIAEEHAVSMAGGLAKQGMVPVVAIYSTFLQRAYDQILQDIALLNLHVVLAVDRAGLVGEDGATHHGVFDVGYLRHVPGLKILAPASLEEMRRMLRWAVKEWDGPVAVRYPRGADRGFRDSCWNPEKTVVCHRTGSQVTLLTYGTLLSNVLEAADLLAKQGIEASVLRLTALDTFSTEEILAAMGESKHLIVVEETMAHTGILGELSAGISAAAPDCRVSGRDLGSKFVPHGALEQLYQHCAVDAGSIAAYTKEVLGK